MPAHPVSHDKQIGKVSHRLIGCVDKILIHIRFTPTSVTQYDFIAFPFFQRFCLLNMFDVLKDPDSDSR